MNKGSMRRDVTLTDIAGQVGVSARTVSRVVNDEGGFSEATRRRVLDAIEKLGYRPNMMARGLITKRSSTVGLVGGDMTDPYFPAVAEGVQQAARASGRTMFFASTDSDADRQSEVLDSLRSHAVDGVIVFPAGDSLGQLADHARRGLPLVVIDDHLDCPNVACVSFDLMTGAIMATRHLQDRGCRSLGLIGSSWSPERRRRRERGFAAVAGGSTEAEARTVRVPPTVDGGRAGATELTDRIADLDGIVAYNDLVAIGAIRELQALGLRVPDDVAVVGFDDIDMSAFVTPALTTMRLDRKRLSEEAIQALERLVSDDDARPEPVLLPVELVKRDST